MNNELGLGMNPNEIYFKSLLDSAPEAMVIVNTDGQIVLVNNKLCEISGYLAAELIGQLIEILVPMQMRAHHIGLRNGYINDPTPRLLDDNNYQLACRRKDGTEFLVAISLNAIQTPSGQLISAAIRDVSEQKAYEERLVASEARMQLALESGDMEVYEIDFEKGRVYSNFHLYRKYGYTQPAVVSTELEADPWMQIIDANDRERALQSIRDFIQGKTLEYRAQYQVLTTAGALRWIETNGLITARQADGKPKKLIKLRRDITDIKLSQLELQRKMAELKESEQRLHEQLVFQQALMDTLPNPIFYKDASTRFLGFNKAYEETFNVKASDLIGLRVMDLAYLPEEDRIRYQQEDEDTIRALSSVKHEMSIPFSDGNFHETLYWVTAFQKSDGAAGGLIGTFIDISEQKEIARQLASAKEKAEAATQAKATFLASMSHEIRTPMNAVIGMVDLLRQTQLTDEQNEMLKVVSLSGQSLLTIINDILDVSKIESGKLQLESISLSLAESIEGAVKTISVNAHAKGLGLIIWIDPALPSYVVGDPVRLRQIVINLVGNAIKFTAAGNILVRVTLVEQREDKVLLRLSVKDRGIGIASDAQQNLFREFTQAESSTTRKYGGTGLGLSICKRLSELMGGSIHVVSELGKGSEFVVELAFPPDLTKPEALDKSLFRDVRVVLIHANTEEAGILHSYLTHLGAQVQTCEELRDCHVLCATAAAEGNPIHIVMVGSGSPRAEQFGLARQLGAGTRVIALVVGKGEKPRIQTEDTLTLDIAPFTRTSLINAVSIALGRASPAVYYEAVEDLTTSNDLLTIAEAEAAGTLILVAEDNSTNRDVIGRQLRLLGYTCEMTENGKEALKAWESGRYRILLTDCHMPEMDGFELTAAIRAQEQQHADADDRFPIIAITANALQGEAERCIAAGMDGYMSKPIDIKELRNVLRRYIVQPQSLHEAMLGAPSTQKFADASTAAVDASVLKGMFGDDEQTFREILTDFVSPSEALVHDIHAAWDKSSAPDLQHAAHKLKSASRSIGANALADACVELENAGKQGRLAGASAAMSRLDALMQAVTRYIRDLDDLA
ncbi:MAG: PAS domain S-box protein [Pseudomonadota bacterium]